jgi:hypothetical protein
MECPTVKASLKRASGVNLSTPTAVKVAEIALWIHHSQIKPASPEWECIPDPALSCKITPGCQCPSSAGFRFLGSWGYRTPIFMLNRFIRLQTVAEIITNETARALNLLAKQSTKMRNAIYQNCLALDYLLASEGGVCGKFNLSNCC